VNACCTERVSPGGIEEAWYVEADGIVALCDPTARRYDACGDCAGRKDSPFVARQLFRKSRKRGPIYYNDRGWRWPKDAPWSPLVSASQDIQERRAIALYRYTRGVVGEADSLMRLPIAHPTGLMRDYEADGQRSTPSSTISASGITELRPSRLRRGGFR